MIGSIKHRGLKRLYERGDRSKVSAEYVDKLRRILFALEQAATIEDIDLPGFRLHPLKENLRGWYAIIVRANWRVIFRFQAGWAYDIDLVDYH